MNCRTLGVHPGGLREIKSFFPRSLTYSSQTFYYPHCATPHAVDSMGFLKVWEEKVSLWSTMGK